MEEWKKGKDEKEEEEVEEEEDLNFDLGGTEQHNVVNLK